MRYAQIKRGLKLHIVMEPGEEYRGQVIRTGYLSNPLCGQKTDGYRMTINMPLANACKKCVAIANR